MSRVEVVELYAEWLSLTEDGNRLLIDAEKELKGLTLCCWCAPEYCHLDILAYLIN